MSRLWLTIATILVCGSFAYADDYGSWVGNTFDGYSVLVSSVGIKRQGDATFTSTGTLVSSQVMPDMSNTDYTIYVNAGGYGIYVDGDEDFTIAEPGPGSFHKADSSWSPSGRLSASIYAKLKQGLSGWTTVYISLESFDR